MQNWFRIVSLFFSLRKSLCRWCVFCISQLRISSLRRKVYFANSYFVFCIFVFHFCVGKFMSQILLAEIRISGTSAKKTSVNQQLQFLTVPFWIFKKGRKVSKMIRWQVKKMQNRNAQVMGGEGGSRCFHIASKPFVMAGVDSGLVDIIIIILIIINHHQSSSLSLSLSSSSSSSSSSSC